jgi:hypothetical protein
VVQVVQVGQLVTQELPVVEAEVAEVQAHQAIHIKAVEVVLAY